MHSPFRITNGPLVIFGRMLTVLAALKWTERDFGANRFGYFDLRRIGLRTTLEHKSAFLSGTNRQCRPNAPTEPLFGSGLGHKRLTE
jgi:hypothetical protein